MAGAVISDANAVICGCQIGGAKRINQIRELAATERQ
jgi:hypothetical protein